MRFRLEMTESAPRVSASMETLTPTLLLDSWAIWRMSTTRLYHLGFDVEYGDVAVKPLRVYLPHLLGVEVKPFGKAQDQEIKGDGRKLNYVAPGLAAFGVEVFEKRLFFS